MIVILIKYQCHGFAEDRANEVNRHSYSHQEDYLSNDGSPSTFCHLSIRFTPEVSVNL